MISINFKNEFLGRTLAGSILDPAINIALLQVAAKIQELLILASLTTIVVHRIREQMLIGDGVPFGILGGAFLFSSLSYFWSPEFWGSMKWRNAAWTKIRLYGTLVLSGFLAAAAGPASAVLLIPRHQAFDAGGASIFLRGSLDEVWPSELRFSSHGLESFCAFSNATEYALCPSGGYLSMQAFQGTTFPLRNYIDMQQNISSFSLGPTSLAVQSTLREMPPIQLSGNWRSYSCQTSMTGVHSASAIFLSKLLGDWHQTVMSIPYQPMKPSISQYKYYNDLSTDTTTRFPTVRVGCSDGQNISASNNNVRFPVMPALSCWNSTSSFSFPALNQTPSDRLRANWVSLPDEFGSVSTGLVFEAPWVAEETSRVLLGCSIDARWTDGSMRCQANGPCFESGIMNSGASDGNTDFRPVDDPSWSRIHLQQSWLDILTTYTQVKIPEQSDWNATTLESLLAGSGLLVDLLDPDRTQTEVWNEMVPGGLNRTITLEWVLAALITDGLSREGSARIFNTTGPVSSWTILDYNKTDDFSNQLLSGGHPLQTPSTPNLIENRVSVTITGYSYKASTTTDYLSIAVLLTHILFAFSHIIETIITGRSSGCWDTVTELLALMQNSRPARNALRNTGAGIYELTTYAKVAAIRAVHLTAGNGTETPHIEVLFREDQEDAVELQDLLEHIKPLGSISSSHARTWSAGSSSAYLAATTGQEQRDFQESLHSDLGRSRGEATTEDVRPDILYG